MPTWLGRPEMELGPRRWQWEKNDKHAPMESGCSEDMLLGVPGREED